MRLLIEVLPAMPEGQVNIFRPDYVTNNGKWEGLLDESDMASLNALDRQESSLR
jgi:hypothetical protein